MASPRGGVSVGTEQGDYTAKFKELTFDGQNMKARYEFPLDAQADVKVAGTFNGGGGRRHVGARREGRRPGRSPAGPGKSRRSSLTRRCRPRRLSGAVLLLLSPFTPVALLSSNGAAKMSVEFESVCRAAPESVVAASVRWLDVELLRPVAGTDRARTSRQRRRLASCCRFRCRRFPRSRRLRRRPDLGQPFV